MRRRAALAACALAAALILAGCANIPSSGSVSKLTIPQGGAGSEPISLPDHPVKGASQQEILEGFIKAGRGPALNYSVAREFLTDDFRNKWNPNAGALISSSPIVSATIGDNELQIAVSVSAEVDADGLYTAYVDAPSKPLQFHFKKDSKGQWRISSAPDGTVLTPNRFASIFRSDGQPRANQDFSEIASGCAAAPDTSFDLNLKIGVFELGSARNVVERCRKAAGKRAQQQLLGSPATLQAAQFGGLGEMNRVGGGLALGQSSAARRPPSRNAIGIFSRHFLDSWRSQNAPFPLSRRQGEDHGNRGLNLCRLPIQ